jgi:hypothetical protein
MQTTKKISLGIIAILTTAVALAFSAPMILAQTAPAGHYDPQTQFPVGTQFTFTSFNGVAGQVVDYNTTTEKPILAGYPASAIITVQVDRLTLDGGIHWKVLSGSFVINGETYTITGGDGHMGMFDRVASGMDGTATGPNGDTYHWHLAGLTGIYNGSTIISSLNGKIATVQNGTTTAYGLELLCTAT